MSATDPFTEAAAEAARQYARTPRMNVGTVRDRIAQAHADGWEAARTHTATQDIPAAVPDLMGRALSVGATVEASTDTAGSHTWVRLRITWPDRSTTWHKWRGTPGGSWSHRGHVPIADTRARIQELGR